MLTSRAMGGGCQPAAWHGAEMLEDFSETQGELGITDMLIKEGILESRGDPKIEADQRWLGLGDK